MKRYFLACAVLLLSMSPVSAQIPNDPNALQWAYEDIGVERAWDRATGSRDVVVAVIDNGFDTGHPDLFDNAWKNSDEIADNGIDDDKNGYIDDVWGWNFVVEDLNGDGVIDEEEKKGNNDPRPDAAEQKRNGGVIHHGTVVAGLIGAVGNNGKYGLGVNWAVRLMNIKILNNTGFGSFALLDAAIRYAVDNGADVINMSVVGFSNDIFEDALNYAFEKGVVVVAAAGNENLDLNRLQRYPICSDAGDDRYKVIGVSAITEEHHITNFSNVGSDCIDLTAPGENISSTLRFSPTNDLDEKYGGGWTGTSFAAPLVSGTAALLKSIQPGWGPKEIYTAITETAHHTPGQDEIAYAHLFGAGLLQVDKAVQYALERPRILRRQAVASSLFAINKKTGDIYTGFFDDTASTREVYAHLKGVDTVVSYVADDGDVEHIVKRTIDAATSRIEIYNGEWALVQWWVLPFSGDVSIAVGDVLGTAKSEVIIAPKEGGTFYFRVYSISGTLLSEYVTEQEHDGVSLALAADAEREHLQIVLLYDNGAGLTLGVFDGSGVLVDERRLDEPTRRGNIVAADIDADGTDEYILSAGAGNAPFLYYIKTDGALLRKFWGYAGEYTAGISLGKLDYDMDGRDDVLMWSEDGTQPIRIWNYRSQKLFQWQPFEEPVNVSLDVVPTF